MRFYIEFCIFFLGADEETDGVAGLQLGLDEIQSGAFGTAEVLREEEVEDFHFWEFRGFVLVSQCVCFLVL